MQIKRDYTVPALREKVWEYFTNPEFLQQCIPGCKELKPLGDDTYEATLNVGIAAIKGVYTGFRQNGKQRAAFRVSTCR